MTGGSFSRGCFFGTPSRWHSVSSFTEVKWSLWTGPGGGGATGAVKSQGAEESSDGRWGPRSRGERVGAGGDPSGLGRGRRGAGGGFAGSGAARGPGSGEREHAFAKSTRAARCAPPRSPRRKGADVGRPRPLRGGGLWRLFDPVLAVGAGERRRSRWGAPGR